MDDDAVDDAVLPPVVPSDLDAVPPAGGSPQWAVAPGDRDLVVVLWKDVRPGGLYSCSDWWGALGPKRSHTPRGSVRCPASNGVRALVGGLPYSPVCGPVTSFLGGNPSFSSFRLAR